MRWLALVLAPLPLAAQAQERPAPLPTRDVDVTYRSEQAGQVIEQRSRFAAATQRMRLDTPTPGLYMIVDYRTHLMAMVSDPDRAVIDMNAPANGPGGTLPASAYTRRGEDKVAGLPCTEWEAKDTQGQLATACFTADGVMLRARRGTQILAVAARVTYNTMDPALFTVPAGYSHATRRPAP